MTEKGTERAARVADLMQTLARLLVLVIIIPAAILLAVYFLLEGVIQNNFIRGLFSLTFGLGLAGMFVARSSFIVAMNPAALKANMNWVKKISVKFGFTETELKVLFF